MIVDRRKIFEYDTREILNDKTNNYRDLAIQGQLHLGEYFEICKK
jgi:hypothetical protein